MGCQRDREGREIGVLDWSDLWSDLSYRIVRDEVVVPTTFQVRTVWEGIDDVVGAMFAIGYTRDGQTFTDLAEADTEEDALRRHTVYVSNVRTFCSLTPPATPDS